MSHQGTAIIVGVGPGLGASLVRVFAAAGMPVAACARNAEKVAAIIKPMTENSSLIRAYECDATSDIDVHNTVSAIESDLGPLTVAVYNAGAFVPNSILDTTSEEFETCWRAGCLGAFHLGKTAARRMVARDGGSIIFTGATAARRGGARFHNLAVPKFGLRALAQSMARELGPQGIHVGHVVIDGLILGEKWGPDVEESDTNALLHPDAIAQNYLMLHQQPKNAWTLELDLRPSVENF